MENILVIGIAGGSGSGKTTLMNNIVKRFEDNITVLSHDSYYRRHDDMTYEERCELNYDEPGALETDLMVQHLDQLRRGEAIDCPVYDFTIHNRSDETQRIEPRKVIIVEGILIFENEELRNLMDIRIFVDTDADSVLMQYQQTVKPMYEKYVEPSKKNAHILVPEGGKNAVALDLIENLIAKHIEGIF